MPGPENVISENRNLLSVKENNRSIGLTKVHRMTRSEYLFKISSEITIDKNPLITTLQSAFVIEKCADNMCAGPEHRMATSSSPLAISA